MEWKCNKCGSWVTVENGKMPLFCPNCGRTQDEINELNLGKKKFELVNTSPSRKEQLENAHICPICCSTIEANDKSIVCPDCNTAYHDECWQENHGCATYGCKSAPQADNIKNQYKQSKVCPVCQASVEQDSIRCTSCGQIIDKSTEIKNKTSQIQNIIKIINNRLIILQNDINIKFERIKPKIHQILSYYVYSLRNFIKFNGCDGRKQFTSFVFVSFLIYLILLLISNKKIFYFYIILTFCPTISGIIRRLRDIKLSPWFLFSGPLLLLLLFVPTVRQDEDNSKENSTLK